jgi:hypothetical protein
MCGELEHRIAALRSESIRQIRRRKGLCVFSAQIQQPSDAVQQQTPHRMKRNVS